MNTKKVMNWTIEEAQMKHVARKYSMSSVAQTYLRKTSAEAGIDDYKKLLEDLQGDPSKYDSLTDAERDFCDVSSSLGVWATVAGCVKPYISIDQWLALDYPTVELLSDTASEINPHWFAQPEQEKKTDATPSEFTENSQNS